MSTTGAESAAGWRLWLGDFVLLAAIWGSSFLFTRIGALEFGALPTAGLRVVIAGCFLFPVLMVRLGISGLKQHWKLTFTLVQHPFCNFPEH